MKKYRFLIKLISMIIVVSVFCSSSIISVYSAAGTILESEGNNSVSSADWTYNDYDSYGSISYSGDIDFWKVTFPSEGMVNFYLGNIPSGCDYDMIISDSTGLIKWATDFQPGNAHELIRLHVKANTTYYIKIYSSLYYSSSVNYLLRVKWNPLNDAVYFSYTREVNEYYHFTGTDNVAMGNTAVQYFSDMNFSQRYNFVNNEAAVVMSNLPFSQLMIIHNHSNPGVMYLPTSYTLSSLYAVTKPSMTSDDRALSTLANSALSNTSLVVFCGCRSGKDDNNQNNLVDMAVSKGAICALGWTEVIYSPPCEDWLEVFLAYCAEGATIYDAADFADLYLREIVQDYETNEPDKFVYSMEARYWGPQRAEDNAKSTVLALCQ